MRAGLRNVGFLAGRHTPTGGSGAFSLDSISGLVAWYAADKITGLSNGSSVTSWTQSAGGTVAAITQGTPSRQPAYTTGVVNGLPVVRFTGASSQYLQGSDSGMPTGDFTWVIVAKLSTDIVNGTYQWLHSWGQNTTNRLVLVAFNKNTAVQNRNWLILTQNGDSGPLLGSQTDAYNIFNVYVITRSGNDYSWYIGTKTALTRTMNSSTTLNGNTHTLGNYSALGTAYFNGDVAELGVYNKLCSGTEVNSILDGLAAKYGITLV